jgi:NAD(P)H-dependent flavin oxidoreductase YrpB (nitropropane dioxygenase family)
MAFVAAGPLVRAVCEASGMGILGIAAMPPDLLQEAIRDVKAVSPACFGVDIIARFSGLGLLLNPDIARHGWLDQRMQGPDRGLAAVDRNK